MSTKRYSVLLILFAKEPIPGRVKTRLIPCLGAQGAYQLYQQLLQHQLDQFISHPLWDFSLYLSPDKNSIFAQQLRRKHGIDIQQQQGHDLGERMYHAIQTGLSQYSKVILIGADCPFLKPDTIKMAIQALDEVPLVFNPALDGGYLLIGANKIAPDIFKGIDWSTERVMRQTRQAIERLEWQYKELSPLADIDDPADLELLAQTSIRIPPFVDGDN